MGQVIFEDNVKFKAKKEKQLQAIKELQLSEMTAFIMKHDFDAQLQVKQDKIDTLETTLSQVLARLDVLEGN